MKAAILHKLGSIERNELEIEDVHVPTVSGRQVLVKVEACGVCRSNLHMIEGEMSRQNIPAKLPIIPGHELVGKVVEVGDENIPLSEGDRVGVTPVYSSCGKCSYCLNGQTQLCLERITTGEDVDGGFAEYIAANADYVFPIPDGLSEASAAPMMCAGVTAYGAVKKACLCEGKRVAVIGVGGVGHLVVQFAKLLKAEVTAVSRSQKHLQVATELGADVTINLSEGFAAEKHLQETRFDSCIVFAPSQQAIELAVKSAKPDGTVVLGVGAILGGEAVLNEKRLVGNVIGTVQDVREVLRLAAEEKVRPVVERFRLEEVNDVLKKLKSSGLKARGVLIF